MEKVIFIDRDGVLNEDPIGDYIKAWKDFKFMPGAVESLKRFHDAGYKIVIISNQAGIGDGVYKKEALDEITVNMLEELKKKHVQIDDVHYCLHGKREGCDCRKPKTGLLVNASKKLDYDKDRTYFIGDKLSDVQAGRDFGLKTIMVLSGHGQNQSKKITEDLKPDFLVKDIVEATDIVLKERNL